MEPSREATGFRGRAAKSVARVSRYLLAIGLLTSLAIAGDAWLPFLVTSLAVLAPCLLILYGVIARWDRFRLDDERQAIVSPLRAAIPYRNVESFQITLGDGLMTVSARTAGSGRALLGVLLDSRDRRRLVEALDERCPRRPWTENQNRSKELFLAMLALMLGGYLAALFYVYRTAPVVATPCLPADWVSSASSPTIGRRYELRGVSFAVPDGFRLDPENSSEQAFTFRNEAASISLVARAESLDDLLANPSGSQGSVGGLERKWVLRAFGITSSYELFRLVYCARVGLIPLIVKSVVLARDRRVPDGRLELYETSEADRRVLVKLEHGAKEGRAEIRLDGGARDPGVHFLIRTGGPLDKQFVAEILKGL